TPTLTSPACARRLKSSDCKAYSVGRCSCTRWGWVSRRQAKASRPQSPSVARDVRERLAREREKLRGRGSVPAPLPPREGDIAAEGGVDECRDGDISAGTDGVRTGQDRDSQTP